MRWTSAAASGGTVVAWGDAALTNSCAINVVAIATGYQQTLLLRSDGTVANCGTHYYGVPIIVPAGLTSVVAIAGGYSHSLALKADGTVVAWGVNTVGQTVVPVGLSNVVAISASDTHSLALRADGAVIGWGNGSGNIPMGLSNVVAVAAGSANLALKADGTVVGWNTVVNSAYRNLTNGIEALTNIVAVSAGWNEWLALKADGTVMRGSYLLEPRSMLNNVVAISASSGTDHHISLAVQSDGSVVGWGFNFYGGPAVPPGLANVVAVSSDSSHSLALVGGGGPFLANRLLDRDTTMSGKTFFRIEATGASPLSYQWRLNGTNLPGANSAVLALTNLQPNQAGAYSVRVSNAYGNVTSDSAALTLRPLEIIQQPQRQTNFVSGTTVFSVAVLGIEPLYYQWRMGTVDLVGETNSSLSLTNLQLTQTGSYSVMVSNSFDTIVSYNAQLTVLPMIITAQPQATVTFVGGTAAFGVAALGDQPLTYQWQLNNTNLDGVTNSLLSLTNVQRNQAGNYSVTVSNGFGTVTSLEATFSVVVVAAWGNIPQMSVPGYLTNVVGIASGLFHNLVLTTDGLVVDPFSLPAGLTNVVAVASGCYAEGSLALKENGTVVMWGNNSYGWPPLVSVAASHTNIVATAGGQSHMLALRADGTVVAWGDNTVGQTSLLAGLTNVVAIAAGQNHSLALRADGTVRACGYNNYGQTNVPTSLSNAVAIAAGALHSVALRADGTVVVWGGDTFYGPANPPAGLTDVVAIAAGEFHSLALKADGTVVAWGAYLHGQTNVPVALTNVIAVAAGGRHSLALVGDGPPVLQAPLLNPAWDSNGFRAVVPTQSGRVYRLEYKHSLTDSDWISLPLVAGNGGLRTLSDPAATGTQRFYRVPRW